MTTWPDTLHDRTIRLGAVYRVDPKIGATQRAASRLLGATSLAIAPDGTIYVSERYRSRVVKISNGSVRPLISLTEPAAVEWAGGHLHVSTNVVFGDGTVPHEGKIVRLR